MDNRLQYTHQIRINHERRFQVVEFARWTSFGDAWMCTHDLFHHFPGDNGSMHHEAMSFGAELWIGFPSAGTDAIATSSFAGVASAVYQAHPDLRALILRKDPPPQAPPEDYVQDRLREVVDGGLALTAGFVARWRSQAGLRAAGAAGLAALTSAASRARYLRWMGHGYRQAQRRFPAPRKAQRFIEDFRALLDRAAQAQRSRIMVDIDEASLQCRLRGRPFATAGLCEPDH